MELVPFIAESASDAVAQIRTRLGAEAVVVNVRPLPASGLARLWRRTRFEVLAYRPPPDAPGRLDLVSDAPASPHDPVGTAASPEGRRSLPSAGGGGPVVGSSLGASRTGPAAPFIPEPERQAHPSSGWRMESILQQAGFLPANVQRVMDELRGKNSGGPPSELRDEIAAVRGALARLWRRPPVVLEDSFRPHVLVGPPGVGKTTALCKWLTQTVLLEGRTARAWRLDAAVANTAESLSVYCDVLGVPLERSWQAGREPVDKGLRFIDLPGVDWRDRAAIGLLGEQLRRYLVPHVHLVLNGAYEVNLLLAQARAFESLPVEDLIITHLDEEPRWGKLWNLVLGTNYSVRFLSAGQNIPGEFLTASADALLARQFPS